MIKGEILILRKPTLVDEQEIVQMVQEFKDAGEEKIVGAGGVENFETYSDWLKNNEIYSDEKTVPEGRVPSTQFISIRISDNKIIGFVQLRHRLNDFLLKYGGHIGDSVRPTERRKGYATEQLILCNRYAKSLGIDKVLITCKDWNVGSKKSIIKSGGKYENSIVNPNENNVIMERYWIETNSL